MWSKYFLDSIFYLGTIFLSINEIMFNRYFSTIISDQDFAAIFLGL